MNIDKIKTIVNDPLLSDMEKESKIISVISQDDNAIPTLLAILSAERNFKKQLLLDMNLELSRADVHIQNPTLAARDAKKDEQKLAQAREFVLNHITAFYVKYKGHISHCFNKQV